MKISIRLSPSMVPILILTGMLFLFGCSEETPLDPALTGTESYSEGDPFILAEKRGVDIEIQDGSVTPSEVGTIYLANFMNPEGMLKVGSNLYITSASSGNPVISEPGADGAGVLMQKHIEKSNTDPVRELTSLIEAQRAFELNSKAVQTGDEMMQVISNMKRF